MVDLDYGFQDCDNQDEFNKFTSKAVEFFTRILNKYNGSPNLLLELWNEPKCTWDKISEYHSKVLEVNGFNFLIKFDKKSKSIYVGY